MAFGANRRSEVRAASDAGGALPDPHPEHPDARLRGAEHVGAATAEMEHGLRRHGRPGTRAFHPLPVTLLDARSHRDPAWPAFGPAPPHVRGRRTGGLTLRRG